MYTTPSFATSSLTLWYTSSESYCAPTPASDFLSACGIPSLSNVFFISSGTSDHFVFISVLGLTYVTMLSILRPSIDGPQSGTFILLYICKDSRRKFCIHAGSFFSFESFSTISGVRPALIRYASFSSSLKSYIFLSMS